MPSFPSRDYRSLKTDKKQQLLQILQLTGLFTGTEFAREFERRFGYNFGTILNYIIKNLSSYKKNLKYYPQAQQQTA